MTKNLLSFLVYVYVCVFACNFFISQLYFMDHTTQRYPKMISYSNISLNLLYFSSYINRRRITLGQRFSLNFIPSLRKANRTTSASQVILNQEFVGLSNATWPYSRTGCAANRCIIETVSKCRNTSIYTLSN